MDGWQPGLLGGHEFAQYSLEAEGDFPFQYGQHDVELMSAEEVEALGFAAAEDGQLYLRVYDNNYYAMSSRDDFQVEVPEDVGTSNMEDGRHLPCLLLPGGSKSEHLHPGGFL